MTGRNITRLGRTVHHGIQTPALTSMAPRAAIFSTAIRSTPILFHSSPASAVPGTTIPRRPFSLTTQLRSSDPAVGKPVELSDDEYNAIADSYLENILEKLEELQDEGEEIDCEYAAGILEVKFGNSDTYVINKQPPNKQIWLSSPKTGPKRYDWVIKPGTKTGAWVYLRDGSTINDVFTKEMGTDLEMPIQHFGE